YCRDVARGRQARRRDVTVPAPQPALTDEVAYERVGPVPLPGEPAPQFGLGCDNRRVHAGGDQVLERTGGTRAALAAAGVGLVPARQLARMRVTPAGGPLPRTRDDCAAPPPRWPHRPPP